MWSCRFGLDPHAIIVCIFLETGIVIIGHQVGQGFSEIGQKSIGAFHVINHIACHNRQIAYQVIAPVLHKFFRKNICPVHPSAFPAVSFHILQGGSHMLTSCFKNWIYHILPVKIKCLLAHVIQHTSLPVITGSGNMRRGAGISDAQDHPLSFRSFPVKLTLGIHP